MGQRRRGAGDGGSQLTVEGEAQSIAEDRLVDCGGPGREGHRGCRVKDLADVQIVEIGAAHGSHSGIRPHKVSIWPYIC
ncbi:hypothetical protein MMOR_02130 [Mycolicibacterium moriokaense]|uniref:Uncharacterized protein n=1 Tax=Mycolicibacterium moriokaense TaxID=39691 RepID=A0AAD1H670_9MYCO|nr:hypothetical protein MMOR_02130 [Mycolicibacterium moriokaense]